MTYAAKVSSPKSLLSLSLLSFMLFSSSTRAVPIADTDPVIDSQVTNNPKSISTLEERGIKGNLFWTADRAAYSNCCQYSTKFLRNGAFRINLAGWGNTDGTPNVDSTLSTVDCAPGLVDNIRAQGGEIVQSSWTCVPSYGSPGDTYVYFELKEGKTDIVANALTAIDKIAPEWECLDYLKAYKKGIKACDIQMGNTLKSGIGRLI